MFLIITALYLQILDSASESRFCVGMHVQGHQCEPMRAIPALPTSCQGAAARQEKAIQELCKRIFQCIP